MILLIEEEFVVGDDLALEFEFTDQGTARVNPDALTIELMRPDKTTAAFNLADLTKISVGLYQLNVPLVQRGRYFLYYVAEGRWTQSDAYYFDVTGKP